MRPSGVTKERKIKDANSGQQKRIQKNRQPGNRVPHNMSESRLRVQVRSQNNARKRKPSRRSTGMSTLQTARRATQIPGTHKRKALLCQALVLADRGLAN